MAPTDDIVTGNIAEAYEREGGIALAIRYYDRTYELGGAQTKEFTKAQIEAQKK